MGKLNNWNLASFLTATPYVGKFEQGTRISEQDFISLGFRLESDYYQELKNNLDNYFREIGQSIIPTVFLYGYQGSGKTTFLHWYLKTGYSLANYNKIIINMDDIPYKTMDSFKLFDLYFRQKVSELCDDNQKDMITLLKLLMLHKLKIRQITFLEKYKGNSQAEQTESFWSKVESYLPQIERADNYSNAIGSLIEELNYKDLFLLFLLMYHYLPKELFTEEDFGFKQNSNNKKLIIAFDNIDNVRLEVTNAAFPSVIADINGQYNVISNVLGWSEDEKISLNFIFSLRDYNETLIDYQKTDTFKPKTFKFEDPENITMIMQKRIDLAIKHNASHSRAIDFYKVFFTDARFQSIFLPLFNYNIRKLSVAFVSMVPSLDKKEIKAFLEIRNYYIKDNQKNHSIQHGLRGIFYAMLITQILEDDFMKSTLLREAGEFINNGGNGGFMNPARIILTIIHSMMGYNGSEGTIISTPQKMGNVYQEYSKIFKENPKDIDIFFDKLADMFLFYEKAWCHLVSFRNIQVYNKIVFNHHKQKLKDAIKSDTLLAAIEELNSIEVRINKSAHIYLTKIASHYEFYSMRTENKNPLFLTFTTVNITDNTCQACLDNMNAVWIITNGCLNSLIAWLRGVGIDYEENTHFALSDGNRESKSRTSMAFRIIHAHLRYIDNFRNYIFSIYTSTKSFDFKNLNREIIKIQKRYVERLEELCEIRPQQGYYKSRKNEFKNNLQQQYIDYRVYKSLFDKDDDDDM
jgi:hypothetical protein